MEVDFLSATHTSNREGTNSQCPMHVRSTFN